MAMKHNIFLRTARMNAGLSQGELADALGISVNTVSRWERGENIPTAFFRARLCKLFQLSEQELGWTLLEEEEKAASNSNISFVLDPCLPPGEVMLGGQQSLVKEIAHSHRQIIGLVGLPGCGKTAIARAISAVPEIEQHLAGIFWATVGQISNPLRHLQRWAMLLGREVLPENLEDAQDVLRVMLGGRKILVVLDDVWSAHDIAAYDLGSQCRYLLTTRQPGLAETVCNAIYSPHSLSNGQAFNLLVNGLPASLVREHTSVLRALCQQVGNLPLALKYMEQYLRQEAHSHSQRRFQEALTHLFRPEVYLNIQILPGNGSLSHLLQQSEMGLPAYSQQAMRILATHFPAAPAHFSEREVADLFQTAQKFSLSDLDRLVDAGLLSSIGRNRYQFHPVITAYARLTASLSPDEVSERQNNTSESHK